MKPSDTEEYLIHCMQWVLPNNVGGITLEDLINIFDFKDEVR